MRLGWLVRSSTIIGARVINLADILSLLHALQKGRSGRHSFTKICRRMAALAVATNLHFEMHDMKSELNLADELSKNSLGWRGRG